MFVHFSSLSSSAGAGSSTGATRETAAQDDKTYLRERIWCIYSTAVKIPEVNEPLPSPQLWVVQHLPEEKKLGSRPSKPLLLQVPTAQREVAAQGRTRMLQGSSSCDRGPVPGTASLLLRDLCWISSEPCPGGWPSPDTGRV